ncbi:hypothetical protein [Paludifilum halophilum]|uniref:Uncharacterized protein n=1 Tax=Paludifilum halophilum TaxID=1642702 RepID=A0A235B9E8_9BACL|nr:hypothetical protein [Paludifilum halophilum]OYD08930.1 hypothetical protein CHM34_03890 [Paludifilum halophilum]
MGRKRRRRHRRRKNELKQIIKLLKILVNKSWGPQIVVNANPSAQAAADDASNTGRNRLDAQGDIDYEQTSSESGPGKQQSKNG